MIRLIAILLLFLQPPPITAFHAQWDGPQSATLSWHQTERACLWREDRSGARFFIQCFEKIGVSYVIPLGGTGGTDATIRPRAGDRYVLRTDDGALFYASLVGRSVYLPMIL